MRGTKLVLSLVVLSLIVLFRAPSHAQTNPASTGIIPDDRAIDWSQGGVVGGIPNRTTICATLNPGATHTDINDALAACSNGVVFLSAGTYNLAGGITFSGNSNVTLRGAGPDQTILKFAGDDPCGGLRANVCIHGRSMAWWGNLPSSNIQDWTAGYAKGATEITLASTDGLAVDTVLVLDQLDDAADTGGVYVACGSGVSFDACPPTRPGRSQQQHVRVTAINGTRVTISPGLYMPNWRVSQQPQAWWWGDSSVTAEMSGVEDLTLDHTDSTGTSGIAFHNAYNCWVKNVQSVNANRNHVWFYQAARIEVRDSYFYGTKSAASMTYGVESFMTSDALAVNNIFQHVSVPLLTGPGVGSVYAYNFMTDMSYLSSGFMLATISGSHDAGTGMNLFEGNQGNQFGMDTTHGTGNLATVFRNYLTGTEPDKTSNTVSVYLMAFNRRVNIVGNVLGTAGYHTIYEDSQASSGTPGSPDTSIYLLGYSATGEQQPLGYDPLVVSSLLRWGNHDYATNQTRWDPAEIPADSAVPATQTLPASLFLSARPGWWGAMPWPAIGPDVTGGQDPSGYAYDIPARVCYDTSPKNPDGTLVFNATSCYGTTP